jgi:hypothetical protein
MTEITNIISAFSADQVVKLTGLTNRQLAYWDDLGFFRPQFAADAMSPARAWTNSALQLSGA